MRNMGFRRNSPGYEREQTSKAIARLPLIAMTLNRIAATLVRLSTRLQSLGLDGADLDRADNGPEDDPQVGPDGDRPPEGHVTPETDS